MTREEAIQWLEEMKATIELYNSLSKSYTFDKFPQALDMAIEALLEKSDDSKSFSDSAEPSLKAINKQIDEHWYLEPSGDLISRADAIEAIMKHHDGGLNQINYGLTLAKNEIQALPSADAVHKPDYSYEADMVKRLRQAEAVPTVIRAKTFMRKEDFDKWAEDIKKQNTSIVCIPCDAEVVSAAAVQGEWIEKGGELVCSVCGNSVSFSRTPKGWVLGKFCQSCGARMKGGDK